MTPFELHNGTLALAVSFIAPLLAIGNLVVWLQTREKAMLWWASGSLTVAAATALPPLAPQASTLGYGALALALGCYWKGIYIFQRRALENGWLALVGLGALSLSGIVAFGPDPDYRDSLILLAIAGLSATCALELLIRNGNLAKEASHFVGALFSINALFYLLFSMLAVPDQPLPSPWSDILYHAPYAVLLALLIGWNFGFVMMAMQRYLHLANELATHDDLTGVLNRRSFGERARHHIKLADRGGPPLSVMAMDLDHFKRINDTYGHQAGDATLREFVRIAQACLRAPDQLGRMGGEEFVALLPVTSAAGAIAVAERLRQKLADTQIDYQGALINVTVSIGIAEFSPAQGDLDSLLEAADMALYSAKRRGRNCVELASQNQLASSTVQLVWDGRFNSGNATIDSEHEQLFLLVNQLVRRAQEDPDIRILYEPLKELLFWLSEHFRHEEAIFIAAQWSGAEEHIQQHLELEARGREVLTGVAAGKHAFGDLLDFLIRDVVAIHLAQEDLGYFSLVAINEPCPPVKAG